MSCSARQPGGVLRCELERGHEREARPVLDHGADVNGQWVTWGSARKERVDGNTKRAAVNARGGKQSYRQGRLAGIRDERLAQQEASYLRGDIHWDPTAEVLTPPPGPSWCEWCHEPTHADRLQLHHVVQRSLGQRATPEDQGDERTDQLTLICQGPGSCHGVEHD